MYVKRALTRLRFWQRSNPFNRQLAGAILRLTLPLIPPYSKPNLPPNMAEKLDPNDLVTLEELAISSM